MPKEIERKFKVKGDFKPYAVSSERICQAYICSAPERTVRIRIKGARAYITIKGRTEGISRYEWEKEISLKEAEELLELCEPGMVDKTRYIVEAGRHRYEIDEFHGDNTGLTLAEIELSAEDEDFIRPEWLGEEVSGDPRYYNSYLSANPYKKWK